MQDQAPIQFQSPEEFQSRPNYKSSLNCNEKDLKIIIGKYGFSEKQRLQCGLNGCNSWHWHGFVIANKTGQETHCGQDCGKRVFGVSWDDLHAEFRRQEDARDRAAVLQRIKDDGASTLKRCNALLVACQPLAGSVQKVVSEIERESALKHAFYAALKNGGRIMGEAERSAFMADDSKSGKRDLVVLATLEGGSSVESFREVERSLIFRVKKPIEDLMKQDFSSLSAAAIDGKLKELRDMSFTLARADTFVTNAQRFLRPGNLQKIGQLLDQLPQKSRTHRTRRIVKGLPVMGTEIQ